ncbi:hypothetical protein OIU77_013700 [Salix suchowensis]|uniref:Calcineurin-like phosphoesterase domain-containing protein n=1 Tax=Salix suchowensis TaxID=1278906 RepID=A0ABQ8ZUR7_9ROSI|nr:hypothetical protein OIU77_013700 [Salix suchowensis]
MEKHHSPQLREMGIVVLMVLCLSTTMPTSISEQQEGGGAEELVSSQPRKWQDRVIEVKGGPESVIWIVQLSDLHFSVHHPERALDFKKIVGPVLKMINPSLVLITGDLTDGKSKDLLTMKQNEDEWIEYQNVMEDVARRSGLDKSIFYDLRGNHDNFGVPFIGDSFDFFSNYSINGQFGRKGNVNSVTLETGDRKHVFVGLDSTMATGLRGPTNLFGHPTDQLLTQIDSQLSQWDSQKGKSITKISFGHFPLSFSAFSESQKSLRDVFLKHSVSAYLCGHLHTRFGKNLKRHHQSNDNFLSSHKFFQLNIHQEPSENTKNCLFRAPPPKEFWEWEMGDWRKSRAMRIVAVDRGHVSYLDIDFKSGTKKTIVLPTFPLDSRFMLTSSLHQMIYDTRPGSPLMIMETTMTKFVRDISRGDIYAAAWNYKAFEDPSPERFWLQIEVIDVMGRSTLSELRPFSVNGLSAKISWTLKEFFVMGCQWDALYYPIFWFADLCRVHVAWFGFFGYLIYLLSCPWLIGQVFTDGGNRGYMTRMGWLVKTFNSREKHNYIGSPDIMVVVLPHFFFVVIPSILITGALAAERSIYKEHFLSLSGKKEDNDSSQENKRSGKYDNHKYDNHRHRRSKFDFVERKIRKVLLAVCLVIYWKHFMNCKVLMKAYEMNPLLHFPVYSLAIPLLVAYTVYKTGSIQ